MKRVFCAAIESADNVDVYVFCIRTENVGVIKTALSHFFKQNYRTNYQIDAQFKLNFHMSDDISKDRLKSYGDMLFEKLKEYGYEESPVDVSVDIMNVFKTRISLPKLTGKALQDSFDKEEKRQFGDLLTDYIELVDTEINSNKGYDFNLLLINSTHYRNIIDIFHLGKLKVDKCVYLPSTLPTLPASPNAKNIGIIMSDDCTYLFVMRKYKLEEYRIVKTGYNNIAHDVMEKYNIERSNVDRFCHENIGKLSLKRVIYHAIRRIFDELYILLLCDNENNKNDYVTSVDKVYIHTLYGSVVDIISVFPLEMRKRFEIYDKTATNKFKIYADAFYNNQKYFKTLPLKVKYERK